MANTTDSQTFVGIVKNILLNKGAVMFAVTLFYLLLDQYTSNQLQELMMGGNSRSFLLWGLVGFSLFLNFLFPLIFVIVAFCGATSIAFKEILGKLEQLIIETLRSWGVSSLWFFVFIFAPKDVAFWF